MNMAISLSKGGNLSLTKTDPNLVRILIGLGWDERSTDGASFDLDASAFLLGATGKVRGDHDFIFYNQLRSTDGSVEHTGDNRSGEGDGDDESLLVDLSKVSPDIEKIAITVTIHDAQMRGQNFGQIANAFIRVVNQDNGVEIVRFDLAEDYSTETAMVFGELYRHGGEWKFRAVGQGYSGGLAAMCQQYGITVA
jgi:tellurium resistance protein TerD